MDLIKQQQAYLQNAISNLDEQLVLTAIKNIPKNINNDSLSESELIPQSEIKQSRNELELVLLTFFGVVMALEGVQSMKRRAKEFGLGGTFKLNTEAKKAIQSISRKTAKSHISTVAKDIYKQAQIDALAGLSQSQIISSLTTLYNKEITEQRAKVIARTETNRAFTMSQYEADKQFIKQNKLQGKVFKKWITRSSNPCPFCESLERAGEVPFDEAFVGLGDVVEVDGKTLTADYTELQSGNAHPNCSCSYVLIIRT